MSLVDIRGRKFQEERIAGASSLERVHAECAVGTARLPV